MAREPNATGGAGGRTQPRPRRLAIRMDCVATPRQQPCNALFGVFATSLAGRRRSCTGITA
jgi:hypothetical protein